MTTTSITAVRPSTYCAELEVERPDREPLDARSYGPAALTKCHRIAERQDEAGADRDDADTGPLPGVRLPKNR